VGNNEKMEFLRSEKGDLPLRPAEGGLVDGEEEKESVETGVGSGGLPSGPDEGIGVFARPAMG